jgi:uncharacterized Ntn-hydrolase superfamily protein
MAHARNRFLRPAAAVVAAVLSAAAATLVAPPAAHATFSIVARDSATGDLGVAVQSHYFAVGPIVPWAEPGVGAIATQSLVEVAYGPRGLALMKQGVTAPAALDALVKSDPANGGRQVAMIDTKGRVAAYTGPRCIPDAGQVVGEGEQFSVQANLMANAKVWPAMAQAYRSAKGDLPERLLKALEAAQSVGGDIRGQQSAAIVVVRGQASERPWADRILDLRVEDSAHPIEELRRLVTLWRAYRWVDRGDSAVSANDPAIASMAYGEAGRLAPDNMEIVFWQAVGLVGVNRDDEAMPLFKKVFAKERQWIELVPRLTGDVGILPNDKARIDRILAQAPRGKK